MKIFLKEQDVEKAVDLLVNKYQISSHLLGELLGRELRDRGNRILGKMGEDSLDKFKVARLFINREGPNIFNGSSRQIRKLRQFLLSNLDEAKLKELFEKYGPTGGNIKSTSYMITPLVKKPWQAGGLWARDFVKALDFPTVFAGVKRDDSRSKMAVEEIQPRMPFPKLVDFQIYLKEKMRQVLDQNGDKTRCVVTLPTGGGKTRVAVEAFIEWIEPRFNDGKYLIWIAQSEELCEQAIQCIKDLWSNEEFYYPLKIYRFFGEYNLKLENLRGGVIVCSIQKIHNSIKSENDIFDYVLIETGAMIIDEAHRATSYMYDNLFERAESVCGKDLFPVCGLTATPGRAGINSAEETAKLVDRFEAYLLKPDLGEEYARNPLKYFRDNGFLAKAKHVVYRSGREYALDDSELIKSKETDEKLAPGFLRRLADDEDRNLLIIKKLLAIPEGKPTLVYACTVGHAHFLSMLLIEKGRSAGVVTAETPGTIRRGLIKAFKKNKLEFLINFGVLTTGFDAPNTEYIVILRPTTSVILYEQIVGRGLRGPKFGGTSECVIIDFADNIKRLGGPLAYERFSKDWYWDEEVNEGVKEAAAARE